MCGDVVGFFVEPQVIHQGVRNIRVDVIMYTLVLPVLRVVLIFLCLPYFVSRGLVPFVLRIVLPWMYPTAYQSTASTDSLLSLQSLFARLPAPNTPDCPDALHVEALCFRFAFLATAALWLLSQALKMTYRCYHSAIYKLYEEKYVIGKRLVDHPLHVEDEQPHDRTPLATASQLRLHRASS